MSVVLHRVVLEGEGANEGREVAAVGLGEGAEEEEGTASIPDRRTVVEGALGGTPEGRMDLVELGGQRRRVTAAEEIGVNLQGRMQQGRPASPYRYSLARRPPR